MQRRQYRRLEWRISGPSPSGFDNTYFDWVEGFENEAVVAETQRQGKDAAVEQLIIQMKLTGNHTRKVIYHIAPEDHFPK